MTLPKQQQVELKSGEVYRGTLVEAEDNWNCQLTNVSLTGRDGALFFLQKRSMWWWSSSSSRFTFARRRGWFSFSFFFFFFFFFFSLFRVSLCSSSSSSGDNTIIIAVLSFVVVMVFWPPPPRYSLFSFLSSAPQQNPKYNWNYAGKHSSMENCYLRGSKIRMVIVPDMLKNAPMFKRIDPRTKSVLAGGGGKK